jgi:hypothetical protein
MFCVKGSLMAYLFAEESNRLGGVSQTREKTKRRQIQARHPGLVG